MRQWICKMNDVELSEKLAKNIWIKIREQRDEVINKESEEERMMGINVRGDFTEGYGICTGCL